MRTTTWYRPMLVAGLLAAAGPAGATTLQQLSLKDLVVRADKVFRGRVVAIDTRTIAAGGAELHAVVYTLRVEESFKGAFPSGKGDGEAFVELRMFGGAKAAGRAGELRRFSPLPDVPQLVMGREYLLFTTRPSQAGLSTTLGLGQGAFLIDDAGKEELTANTFGNLGLARSTPQVDLPARGPVPYARLAQAIRELVVTEVLP